MFSSFQRFLVKLSSGYHRYSYDLPRRILSVQIKPRKYQKLLGRIGLISIVLSGQLAYGVIEIPTGSEPSLELSEIVDVLNGEQVDALSALVHRSNAFSLGKRICLKLKELIPRQQFEIPIQEKLNTY